MRLFLLTPINLVWTPWWLYLGVKVWCLSCRRRLFLPLFAIAAVLILPLVPLLLIVSVLSVKIHFTHYSSSQSTRACIFLGRHYSDNQDVTCVFSFKVSRKNQHHDDRVVYKINSNLTPVCGRHHHTFNCRYYFCLPSDYKRLQGRKRSRL